MASSKPLCSDRQLTDELTVESEKEGGRSQYQMKLLIGGNISLWGHTAVEVDKHLTPEGVSGIGKC